MATENLSLLISAKDNASAALKGVQGSIDKLKTNLSSLKGILSVGVLVGSMNKFATAAQEQEGALALLGSHVKQLGGDFNSFRGRVLETTAALQRKTVYGDEKQIQAVASLTLIMGDQEKALTKLPDLLDFAAAAGMDLEGATRLYGRALEGDISALTRYFPMVKKLIDQNMSAEDILKKVTEATKGSAEAFGNTQPLTKMQNNLSDMAEEIGMVLLPAITKLNEVFMALPTSLKQLVVLAPILVAAFVAMGPVFGGIVAGAAALGIAYGALKSQMDEASKSTGEFTIETEAQTQATDKAKESLKGYLDELRKTPQATSTAGTLLKGFAMTAGLTNEQITETVKQSNDKQVELDKAAAQKRIQISKKNKQFAVANEWKRYEDLKVITDENLKREQEYNQALYDLGLMSDEWNKQFLQSKINATAYGTAERLRLETELAVYESELLLKKQEQEAAVLTMSGLAYQAWIDTAKMGVGSLQNSLGTMFGEILRGESGLRMMEKMWRNFTASVLNLIGQLIAKLIVMKLLMAATGLGGGIGAFAGSLLKGFQTPFGQSRTVPGSSQTAVPVLAHGGERIGRDSGGSGLTINFNGTSYNSDDTAQAIMRQLHQYKLRTGVSFA